MLIGYIPIGISLLFLTVNSYFLTREGVRIIFRKIFDKVSKLCSKKKDKKVEKCKPKNDLF